MALDVNYAGCVCNKCGKAYGKVSGSFYRSYADLYKGRQYLPYCKDCVEGIFDSYLTECKDSRLAMRQLCRKLDLYWNDKIYDTIENQTTNRTIVAIYIQKLNGFKKAGKSYDDTLAEEGCLWVFPSDYETAVTAQQENQQEGEDDDIPAEVVAFWGSGYTADMYKELEQKRRFYMSSFPEESEDNVGLTSIIRQICALELDINRDRAAGKDVSKSVTTHNTLLGGLGLKPNQRDESLEAAMEKTPMGVWIDRFENKRPIPEPDPDFVDVDGIIRYITIWFLGHLCKMLGIRNSYCKLYEEEIAKLRVEHTEYEEDDDETLFNDIFTSQSGGGGS